MEIREVAIAGNCGIAGPSQVFVVSHVPDTPVSEILAMAPELGKKYVLSRRNVMPLTKGQSQIVCQLEPEVG